MAVLKQHKSGVWRIRFWFGGKQYFRSLDTTERKTADGMLASIEPLIEHLNAGRLAVPPDVEDVGTWIVSGGKVAAKPKVKETHTLKAVIDDYFASIPEGAKSENSLATERIHLNHFKDILKGSTPIDSIGVAELQEYVVKRSKESGNRNVGRWDYNYYTVYPVTKERHGFAYSLSGWFIGPVWYPCSPMLAVIEQQWPIDVSAEDLRRVVKTAAFLEEYTEK
jgi:hypothetical protein